MKINAFGQTKGMVRNMYGKLRHIIKQNPFMYKMAILVFSFIYKINILMLNTLRACGVLFRKQNLITSPKYKKIKSLANIHYGKRCFIVCTGPSLCLNDLEKLKDEICFSMNSIVKLFYEQNEGTNWRPLYYSCNNAYVLDEYIDNAIKNGDIKNIFLAPARRKITFKYKNMANIYKIPMINNIWKYLRVGEQISLKDTKFSDNPYIGVFCGGTSTNFLIQIAVYMGFQKIYLLGCDFDFSGEYHNKSIDYGPKFSPSKLEHTYKRMLLGYQTAKAYADSHDIKIYNATRGGKLEVFERVDLDEILKQPQKKGDIS